jgi:protein-L-isoaspartate(D-aspartate) O-methyltransferase
MKRLILVAVWFGLLAASDRYQAERERMVRDQIEARGISRPDVLRAIRSTPRHLFVPELLRPQAYQDRPLPIGSGQTISQPYIVALMTELLEPSKQQKVLEIGTGSGYQAAVLSRVVKQVYTIEIIEELANTARARFEALGYGNIAVRTGDGYKGWPEASPFDRIILTSAPPEVPRALVAQLKPGGRLVAPVGRLPFDQDLIVLDKDEVGRIKQRSIIPVRFVPMVPGK